MTRWSHPPVITVLPWSGLIFWRLKWHPELSVQPCITLTFLTVEVILVASMLVWQSFSLSCNKACWRWSEATGAHGCFHPIREEYKPQKCETFFLDCERCTFSIESNFSSKSLKHLINQEHMIDIHDRPQSSHSALFKQNFLVQGKNCTKRCSYFHGFEGRCLIRSETQLQTPVECVPFQ